MISPTKLNVLSALSYSALVAVARWSLYRLQLVPQALIRDGIIQSELRPWQYGLIVMSLDIGVFVSSWLAVNTLFVCCNKMSRLGNGASSYFKTKIRKKYVALCSIVSLSIMATLQVGLHWCSEVIPVNEHGFPLSCPEGKNNAHNFLAGKVTPEGASAMFAYFDISGLFLFFYAIVGLLPKLGIKDLREKVYDYTPGPKSSINILGSALLPSPHRSEEPSRTEARGRPGI